MGSELGHSNMAIWGYMSLSIRPTELHCCWIPECKFWRFHCTAGNSLLSCCILCIQSRTYIFIAKKKRKGSWQSNCSRKKEQPPPSPLMRPTAVALSGPRKVSYRWISFHSATRWPWPVDRTMSRSQSVLQSGPIRKEPSGTECQWLQVVERKVFIRLPPHLIKGSRTKK
jgi:hypothetical protein